jgi:hypothetical protein
MTLLSRRVPDAEEFVRFIVPARQHQDSGAAIGVVALAYELARSHDTDPKTRGELSELLAWIEDNVAMPQRFNKSTSKGWYRRPTRGLSWLRATAGDHIEKFRLLAAAVATCGHQVVELRETRIGYVTYEDDVQAVAEPFRDTRTG